MAHVPVLVFNGKELAPQKNYGNEPTMSKSANDCKQTKLPLWSATLIWLCLGVVVSQSGRL